MAATTLIAPCNHCGSANALGTDRCHFCGKAPWAENPPQKTRSPRTAWKPGDGILTDDGVAEPE